MRLLPKSFFEGDAVEVAPKLLGKIIKKGECEGRIVEVEAYAGDAASHAAKKPNQGRPMRETYGNWYVYFTYGMHWCCNVTCNKNGAGAVLIRAVEPTQGIELMQRRRGTDDIRKLTTGPACVAQAFGIDKAGNSRPLAAEFGIFDALEVPAENIAVSRRIGIRRAVNLLWRFHIKRNPFVSKAPIDLGQRSNYTDGAKERDA